MRLFGFCCCNCCNFWVGWVGFFYCFVFVAFLFWLVGWMSGVFCCCLLLLCLLLLFVAAVFVAAVFGLLLLLFGRSLPCPLFVFCPILLLPLLCRSLSVSPRRPLSTALARSRGGRWSWAFIVNWTVLSFRFQQLLFGHCLCW